MLTQTGSVSAQAMVGALFAGTIALFASDAARAQSADPDPRWQPWLGCWQPADAPTAMQSPLVCVVPAPGSSGVDLVSIAGGAEVSRERLEATEEQRSIAKEGCSGWESTQWSRDNRRVYLRSEVTCPGAPKRILNGVLAMSSGGEWLDIQGVGAGGGYGVRVLRYRDAGVPGGLRAEMASALAGRQLAVSAARTAAGADIGTSDVVDAARHLDPAVVRAWLVERGQGFDLDGKQLASLSDAGVPGSVTDVMVALSYPKKFTLARATHEGDLRSSADSAFATDPYRSPVRPMSGYFGRSGYSPFGWGYDPYRSGYGYSRYGSGAGYGWYWNRSPYVIVQRGRGQGTLGARAVNGRGYTHDDQRSGGGASGTRTRGSSGSGAARGSGGSGRKAKPRP